MTPTTITSIDAKLEYIVEIMVRMAEYEEKSIKEFRSDLVEIKESSKNLVTIMANNVIESREESRLLNEKLDRLSEQVFIVNETSKRQEHNIDRLVGIVETLVKAEPIVKNA
jgi:tetrahydromethanopterin S-methyltransferase subunit G